MEVNRERVKLLMDQVRGTHGSPENQARARHWQIVPHERWEPALIRTLPAPRKEGGKIPFVIEPGLAMWSEILGFDIGTYYEDPLTYLTAQLEMKVYHAQHFKDDAYIDRSIRILFATTIRIRPSRPRRIWSHCSPRISTTVASCPGSIASTPR